MMIISEGDVFRVLQVS